MESLNYIVCLESLLQKKDLSQTSLAKELGVTHATLNRWLHQKAKPHPKKLTQILAFYQQSSFYEHLEAGVDHTLWQEKFSSINKPDLYPEIYFRRKDLVQDCLLRMTYHTNKIEGSTLSLKETQAILFEDQVINKHSLTEHLEVTNHHIAFGNMLTALQLDLELDINLIRSFHRSLMSRILEEAGLFRNHPVRIVGSRTVPCNYLKIDEKMNSLSGKMQATRDPLGIIMQHAWFEGIHPFSDGNGRLGRLLLNYQLIRAGYPMLIIRSERKMEYYDALEKAQVQDTYQPLLKFCYEELVESAKLSE